MLRAGALLLVAAVASGCAVGVTDPPTEITGAGATFNGTVFSNVEGTTNYWVKYGTTTDYGSSTDQQSVEIDDGDGRPVTVKVRGLAPKTTYHARLCAKDSQAEAGPGCSDGQTFTTLNEDSITGVAASGGCNPECFVLRRIFDAYSSPTGGNPHGTMVLESETADGVDTLNTYDVTCLNVQGNRAAVALRGRDQGFPVPPNSRFWITDGADNGPDSARFQNYDTPPTTCPIDPPSTAQTDNTADYVVRDAQP